MIMFRARRISWVLFFVSRSDVKLSGNTAAHTRKTRVERMLQYEKRRFNSTGVDE